MIATDEELLQKTMSPVITSSPSPENEVEEVKLPEPRNPEVPAMEDFSVIKMLG
jgi:hypothetical protein